MRKGRTFTISTNPYGDRKLYLKRTVVIYPGVTTTLVGCNGSGKSTLMMLLKDQLKKDKNVLVLEYDDRRSGGHALMEKFGFQDNLQELANMMMSSEGERIMIGIGDFISSMRRKIRDANPKELWIFMDAVGSGLSIDGIQDILDVMGVIRKDNTIPVYTVISTNEYEFAKNPSDSIDVRSLKHIAFNTYDDYRCHILETRKQKDESIANKTTP